MKVMVIGNDPAELAGARLHLLKAMLDRGHAVVAAAPGLTNHHARNALEEIGVDCAEFPLSRTGVSPVAEWRTIRALTALMRDHRPDVTYAMTIKPVIYATMAAANAGVSRRYAHITGLGYAFTGPRSGKRALVGKIVEALYRKALRKADRVFFENEDDQSLFLRRGLLDGAQRALVIDGSGVDLDRFPSQPWPEGPMRFVYVGRLLASKGLPELVEATRNVHADNPRISLHIVGPLDDNPDAIARETIERWYGEGAICWRGRLDDVRPELAAAHVFVLPSHREGLPRSTMEAMATGRAIITTDAPGCRRTVIDGENGLLVPVGDAKAIEAAMRRMIAEPAMVKRMGERSISIVTENFSVERVNNQLLDAMEL